MVILIEGDENSMKNQVEIIRKSDFQTSQWSGGTTTQLYIYPEDAKYIDRNFKWRLSSAKVEVEESLFTHLPGFSRIIMIIDGQITLEHEGKHRAELKPFEQDSFMGDWTTKSFGKVTDFNLMMAEGCSGRLEALSIAGGGSADILLDDIKEESERITNAFYIVSGNTSITFQNIKYDVYEGDLFLTAGSANENGGALSIYNKLEKYAKIIRAVIFF